MTSTSAVARTSAESGPAVNAATSKSRSASAAAASAYDEPEACSGCTAAATSGRMLQASPWDSSNSTRATLRWRSMCSMASLLRDGPGTTKGVYSH